jgi:hypothetical protein
MVGPRDDAGRSAVDSGAPGLDVDGGPVTPPGREGSLDAAQCFDGWDDDGIEGADCADTACGAQPICCVGVASEGCCSAPASVVSLDVAGCVDGPLSACAEAAGIEAFGAPLPAIAGGALVTYGSEARDSGLVFPQRVSPSTGIVELVASAAAPTGCASCIDAITFGLARDAFGDPSVRPVVAVQVSGARGDVALVAGGSELWRQALPDEAAHTYRLALRPDGGVRLEVDFAEPVERRLAPAAGELDVVVYGRSTNRSGVDPAPARLLSLAVERRACDIPAALLRGAPTLLQPSDAPWGYGRARAASIAAHPSGNPGDARLAFAADGAIWIARPDGAGGFEVPGGAAPVMTQGDWAPGGLGDPDLVALDDRWLLFVTRVDADGRRSVARVAGGAGFEETFDPLALTDVLSLPIADAGGDFVDVDGASAYRDGADLLIVARVQRANGSSAIVLLRGSTDAAAAGAFSIDADLCGTGCRDTNTESDATHVVHSPRLAIPAAFDHDEVAAPVLERHGGVWRLYYAGRRGTRWSIGMLVSYDLLFFRPFGEGPPLLAGSGAGADALGVSDPEPFVEDGELVLFHTGTDGAATRVLAAEQPLR